MRKTSRRAAMRAALGAIAGARQPDHLWTAAAAAIEIWPYQLEPALAVIGGATRVLLADAVGLGKTIQAGLILSELRERGWVQHVLILCPAGLREGWARELRDRFAIGATVLDQPAIAERIAALPPGANPWLGHDVAIASIDFVKRADVLAALDGVPIDLLIADEAHHLAPGTDRAAAVSALAARAPWFVMASATPHSGDQHAYAHLLSLGSTGAPPIVFRRSRKAVGLPSDRRAHVLAVQPDPVERQLHDTIDAYARELWRTHGTDSPWTRLLAITLARRAASSAAAILRTLERRLDALSGVEVSPTQPPLPWDEEDQADLTESGAMLSAPGLADANAERRLLEQARQLAARCTEGSKLRRLRRLVRSVDEPAIVFTEYRHTLMAVVAALGSFTATVSVHGGMTPKERVAAVDSFNRGDADILVATDAAGEGLNLHHRCRLVVDVELPWNPLRLEQRAGRVDRIGQRRPVHAIRLCHAGSIEMRVLDQLRARARLAEIPFDTINERQIADAVLGHGSIAVASKPDEECHRVCSADEEARLVAGRRRWGTVAPAVEGAWAFGRSRQVVVVVRTTFSSDGMARGEAISAYRVFLSSTPASHAEWRTLFAQLITRIGPDRYVLPTGPTTIAARVSLIRTRLARAGTRAVPRSLFDGRLAREVPMSASAAAVLDHALHDILTASGGGGSEVTSRVEIVGAWCERTS